MTAPLSPFSEVVDEKRRWTPDWYAWLQQLAGSTFIKVTDLPLAVRPPVGDPNVGRVIAAPGDRAFVSDATTTTFGSVVAGGGTNRVPVYCDGTAWRIG